MPRFSPTVVRNPEREKLKKGCLYPPALLSVEVFGLGVVENFGIATATAVVVTQFSPTTALFSITILNLAQREPRPPQTIGIHISFYESPVKQHTLTST